MKFLSVFCLLLLLAACQSTNEKENVADAQQTNVEYSDDLDGSLNDLTSNEEGLSNLIGAPTTTINIDGDVVEEVPNSIAPYSNLWLKLAEGFTFNVPDNGRIAKQRNYYLRHPKYLQQVSKRAEPFLYLIVKQIEDQNLPLELVLLPIVESTFNPFAYSQSSASGLWQFMPATGRRFNLKQDWWYDGRRDVYASTHAALNYMKILHKYLGKDWLHAFAAYNSGEGRVLRAVQKNKRRGKPTDYWHLSLPKETENYVPKLLALVDIFRNHEKYNVKLPFIPNKKVLTYVSTGTQLDLANAAELAELSIAELQLLNPAFNHWATSPDGPHKLLIPSRIADQFNESLAKIDKKKRVRWERYKVISGDTLSVIAQKNGTTTDVLRQINNIDGAFIKIGQPLLIPVASKAQQDYLYSQAQRFQRTEARNARNKQKLHYTVVEGDTLWDISRLYNVSSQDIARWNHTSTKKALRLGQRLTIWKTKTTVTASRSRRAPTRVTYKVQSGDSLSVIAQRFNVKTSQIRHWNELSHKKYIKPGQQLIVYTTAIHKKQNIAGKVNYKVRSGDSLGLIAQRFKVKTTDIAQWNKLNSHHYIKPGQQLVLYTETVKEATRNTHGKINYQVRSGDSLSLIAQRFKIKTADIKRWNQLNSKKYIKVGQQLTIYTKSENLGNSLSLIAEKLNVKSANIRNWDKLTEQKYAQIGQLINEYTGTKTAYKVQSGDSLGVIAEKFNVKTADLVRWNNLTNKKYIKTGQTLFVY